ncbi:hypothetical protein Tco_1559990 [Tanacetum coccineum]
MGKDTIQLEAAISTISLEYLLEFTSKNGISEDLHPAVFPRNLLTPEYLLEFTSEYGISEDLHPELPDLEEKIVDFLEGKVRTGTRPRAAHEVPLLTATANRVIAMEDATLTSGSSGTPSTVEKSPLDFANKDSP